MSWKYGLVRDSTGFLHIAEIYSDGCYTSIDTPLNLGGIDYQEILDVLRRIIDDLEDPLIIEENK